jgi:hypothetical protein
MRGEIKNSLIRKPEENAPLGTPICRSEDSIKIIINVEYEI